MRSVLFCIFVVLSSAANLLSVSQALAQQSSSNYPNRPITLLVGVGAGGATDIAMRLLADKAGALLGQRIVVENRGGGGGVIAATALKRAEPDGYTLMLVLATLHTVMPLIQRLPFDPIDDFTMIAPLYSTPSFLIINSSVAPNTIKDYLKYAHSKPGGLIYASAGQASPGHLMGALFQKATGIPMTHVPFRGSGSIAGELLSQRIDFSFTGYANLGSHLEKGQLNALAVASPNRWQFAPGIPTLAESGFPEVTIDNFFGLAGPKGISPEIVEKLNWAFRRARQDSVISDRFRDLGVVAHDGPPEELTRMLKEDASRLAPLIKTLDLQTP